MDRIRGLDGLRALACLLVIAHHILPRLPQTDSVLSQAIQLFGHWAQSGVSAFFVLSGFLLSAPFWLSAFEQRQRPAFRAYLLKRFARILPGFYLAVSVSFVLSILVFDRAFDLQSVLRLVSGMLFVNSYSAVTLFPTEINGPLWSIGFEVTSYVILLGLLLIAYRLYGVQRYGALVAFFLVSTVFIVAGHGLWCWVVGVPESGVGWEHGLIGFARTWVPFTNVFSMYAHFHVGVLAAALLPWVKNQKPSLKFDAIWLVVSGILGVLIVGAILLTPFSLHGVWRLNYFWPLFPVLFALALVVIPATKISATLLEAGWLRFIAKISFGLYIWHMVFVELTAKFLFPEYVYGGGTSLLVWLEATLIVLVLCALTAWLSWQYLERPVLTWTRRTLNGGGELTPQQKPVG